MRLKFFQPGFPIRISPDLWIFAPPRSFSQLITSFIGSQCQGIHPTLFILNQRCLSYDKLLRFEVIALTSFLRFFSLRLQHLRVAPRMSCHCYDFFVFLCVVFNVLWLVASGDNEIRTRDPLLARQVLSQLSYTPMMFHLFFTLNGVKWTRTIDLTLIRRAL